MMRLNSHFLKADRAEWLEVENTLALNHSSFRAHQRIEGPG